MLLVEVADPPVSQQIGENVRHLRALGLSFEEIGRRLGASHTTVAKAYRWRSGPLRRKRGIRDVPP